jgi:hypothetical protein
VAQATHPLLVLLRVILEEKVTGTTTVAEVVALLLPVVVPAVALEDRVASG